MSRLGSFSALSELKFFQLCPGQVQPLFLSRPMFYPVGKDYDFVFLRHLSDLFLSHISSEILTAKMVWRTPFRHLFFSLLLCLFSQLAWSQAVDPRLIGTWSTKSNSTLTGIASSLGHN